MAATLSRLILRFVSLAIVAACASSLAACATVTRERCSASAPGEAPSDADQILVKRLVRALAMDDVPAFARLQPTESQYVTLAWRFGAPRADEMTALARDATQVKAAFGALRKAFAERGLDPRLAARCTRKMATDGDEPRLYDLKVDIGDGAFALVGKVLLSSGHPSFVGAPVIAPAP